jgi:hypothetical protein
MPSEPRNSRSDNGVAIRFSTLRDQTSSSRPSEPARVTCQIMWNRIVPVISTRTGPSPSP